MLTSTVDRVLVNKGCTERTASILRNLILERESFQVAPQLLSNFAMHPICTDDQVSFINRTVCTMDSDMCGVMIDADGFLVEVYSALIGS